MGRLNGKIAIITGASSGYGRAMALLFAREGASIACLDIREDCAPGFDDDDYSIPTHKRIGSFGGRAVYIQCDVSKPDDVKNAFKRADDALGICDILVNNAGIGRARASFLDSTIEDYSATFAVNLYGSLYCAREALKRFVAKNYGRLIQIGSSASLYPHPLQTAYNMSKYAALAMAQSIAVEYAKYNITSNILCPCYGLTPMNRSIYENLKFREMVTDKIPAGRWVSTADVANYALFLASDVSGMVNGAACIIDGGLDICAVTEKDIINASLT